MGATDLMGLAEHLTRTLRAGGDGDALEQADQRTSWNDLRLRAQAIDEALKADAISSGAVIGVLGRNRLVPAAAFVAVLSSDRCVAMLNPFQPLEQVAIAAQAAGATALVVEEEDVESAALDGGASVYVLMANGEVRAHRRAATHAAHRVRDVALLMSTSGTTGEPKRIPISSSTLQRALREIAGFNRAFGDLDQPGHLQPALIQYSPLAHIAGALTLARGMNEGRTVVLLEKFAPDLWADTVERHRPRTTGLPPAMMKMVLDAAPAPGRLASLVSVWSGSAPVDPLVAGAFTRRYGLPVLGNYGATEFCGAVATWSVADYGRLFSEKPGAVGRILPDVAAARVRHPVSGDILPLGASGVLELQVHRVGPQWQTTTDLAHLDAEGFLYLHGRVDDAILRGGFKVLPDTVAQALKRHLAIAEAAVVGLDDPRLGQVPAAVVECTPGTPRPTEAELIAFVKIQLPAYNAPVAVRFVDALPRTPAMKVDRRAVRALFEDLQRPQGL